MVTTRKRKGQRLFDSQNGGSESSSLQRAASQSSKSGGSSNSGRSSSVKNDPVIQAGARQAQPHFNRANEIRENMAGNYDPISRTVGSIGVANQLAAGGIQGVIGGAAEAGRQVIDSVGSVFRGGNQPQQSAPAPANPPAPSGTPAQRTSANSSTRGISGVQAAQAGADTAARGVDASQRARATISAMEQSPRTIENEYGSATRFPGSGNNELAVQRLLERTPTFQEGADRMAGTRMDPTMQPAGGGRTMFGDYQGPNIGRLHRGVQDELAELDKQIQYGLNTSTPGERLTVGGLNALMGRRNELTRFQADLVGEQAGMRNTDVTAGTSLERQALSNQGQLERTGLQGEYANERMQMRINDPNNMAQAQLLQRELQEMNVDMPMPEQLDPRDLAGLPPDQQSRMIQLKQYEHEGYTIAGDLLAQYDGDVDAALADLRERDPDNPAAEFHKNFGMRFLAQARGRAAHVNRSVPEAQRRANGGLVQTFAQGGLVGGQQPQLPASDSPNLPIQGDMPAIQNYQKYVQLAREMGVPPVDFQNFSKMSAQAPASSPGVPMPQMQQGAMGDQRALNFADGGLVPPGGALDQMQADEKLVMDTDPNAPTDSIPATVDGTQPARLDSGEFVMPADVVMFYGTQKLKKLIEQARKPEGEGEGPAQQPQPAQQPGA